MKNSHKVKLLVASVVPTDNDTDIETPSLDGDGECNLSTIPVATLQNILAVSYFFGLALFLGMTVLLIVRAIQLFRNFSPQTQKIELGSTLILIATALLISPHIGINYMEYWFDTLLVSPLTKIACVSNLLVVVICILLLALLFFAFVRMFAKLPKSSTKVFIPAYLSFPLFGPLALPILAFAPLDGGSQTK